jgi:L-ascorbate metabolism protein UlaG (beta-lactamase superfamily)
MKPTLTFIGHGSLKLKTSAGKVIYIDPFFPGDYSEKADILLVTHNHHDHNAVNKVKQVEACLVVMPDKALSQGNYHTFECCAVKITAVEAYNAKHKKDECVGYVLEFDGLKVYCAGDTSKTNDMAGKLSQMKLDYALLPIDGVFNMGPIEASECAEMLHVRHAIAIHNAPMSTMTGKYSSQGIDKFSHPGKIVLKYGESMELK